MAIPDLNKIDFGSIEIAKPKQRPQFSIIYSQGGCGKTTAAIYSPDPVIVPIGRETGAEIHANWGVPTFDNTIDMHPVHFVFACMARLLKTEHSRRTVIFDNLGTYREAVDEDVVEDNKGVDLKAFGKAQALAYPYYTRLLAGFDALMKKKGMNVILLCHSVPVNINLPDGSYFQTVSIHAPRGDNTNVASLLEARAHNVFHLVDETNTRKVKGAMGQEKIIASTKIKRVIYTKPSGNAFAKSRVNLEHSYEVEPSSTEEELFKLKTNESLIKFWADVYR